MFGYYKIIASHCFTAAVVDFGHWYNVTVLKIGCDMLTLQYNSKHTEVSPRGGETICPPPMAVRRQQKSRRIYVRPRTGPQSAHL